MEYNRLAPFRPAVCRREFRHRHVRRRQRHSSRLGDRPTCRGVPPYRRVPESRLNDFDSADVYSHGLAEGEILGEAIKGKRNRVLISTKATFQMGDGPSHIDYGLVTPTSSRDDGGLAQAAWKSTIDALLQLAWAGLQHAGRGDFVHPRSARARRQGALHARLLELLRLAPDEVARDVGPLWLRPLCRASGVLLAAQSRLRMGAPAARPRSGRRRGRLEPARLGQAHRQDPARAAAETRHSRARHSGDRAAL